MVSTVLRKSIGDSMFVLFWLAWIGHFWLNDSYFFVGIFCAPFVLTLIMGATRCLFRKQYLKNESVQYILFLYSFRRYFDTWCCLALACLCIFIIGPIPIIDSGKSSVFTFFYIVICLIVAMFNAGKSSYDVLDNLDSIESERISTVKVFLLALVLTPVGGLIAARIYKSEQDKKTKAMELHRECAETYLEAKDYTNAIVACKEGVDGTDKDEDNYEQRLVRYDILRMLAEIYCKQEKYSEAIKSYREAMFIFPHDQTYARSCIHSIVGNEWAYESTGIANKALDVVKVYEELYSDEEYFSKERTRLTQIEECASDQYEKSAKAYLEQKDYANAIADYTKAIELAPKDELFNKSYYYNERAWVYFEQEDYANAIADYTKAIELVPEKNTTFTYKASYYDFRAEVYLKQKDYANAIADYTKAIEFASEKNDSFHSKAACYRKRAKVYLEQKDYANAIADYTKAIELNPDWADRYVAARAEVYLKQKDYANAIADYTKAIELADSSHSKAACYRKRAEVYLEQEDYMNAIADYTKAIELKPDWDDYYAARAKVYLAQKDYANAIADCKKAIETNSEFSGAHELLADVYATQEQFASAIESYTNAIETFDSEKIEKKAEIYKKRGEAHQMLGDMEQAEADFAKAKEIEAQE